MTQINIDEDAIRELFTSDEMIAAMVERAEPIAEEIRALAPGDHYPDTIEVVETEEGAAIRTLSPLGHLIEFGTGMRETKEGANRGEMPAIAPFRRGAEAAGANYDG